MTSFIWRSCQTSQNSAVFDTFAGSVNPGFSVSWPMLVSTVLITVLETEVEWPFVHLPWRNAVPSPCLVFNEVM